MQNISSSNSLARLCRQLLFVPIFHNRWLTPTTKNHLAQAISDAEKGHQGEIVLVVENHLPIHRAYRQNSRCRALDVFARHGVWDTEHNTGVLIYMNICEHDLQIVADRGIGDKVGDGTWQRLTQQALECFKQGLFEQGLTQLIADVGGLLRLHYPSDDTQGNELADAVVFLR